jgi:hypothetical protein
MQTGLVRRVLGDAIGLATLGALAIVPIAVYPGIDVAIHDWPTASGSFLVLAMISYKTWIEVERSADTWSSGVLFSIGLGLASLPVDILLGRLFHPHLGLIDSTLSTLSFWLTLFVCPVFTCVLLSGWARSVVLRRGTRDS